MALPVGLATQCTATAAQFHTLHRCVHDDAAVLLHDDAAAALLHDDAAELLHAAALLKALEVHQGIHHGVHGIDVCK